MPTLPSGLSLLPLCYYPRYIVLCDQTNEISCHNGGFQLNDFHFSVELFLRCSREINKILCQILNIYFVLKYGEES